MESSYSKCSRCSDRDINQAAARPGIRALIGPQAPRVGDARRSPDTGLQLLCLTALHRLHTPSTCTKSHNRTHTHMLPWNRVSTLGGHTDDALSPSSNIRPFSQPAYGVTHTYICMYTHKGHIHTISAAAYYLHNHREDQFPW